MTRRSVLLLASATVVATLMWLGVVVVAMRSGPEPVASFRDQTCSMPAAYLERTLAGYFPGRSGQIQLIPDQPAYFASGAGGWSHSGPWPYLQDVPLIFYGPGIIPPAGDVDTPATMADVAPTLAELLDFNFDTPHGDVLEQVTAESHGQPRLVVGVVWDGGGWNTLRQWPDAWPNLARLAADGVSFTNATVGSSPSVTPSVHTTLGTGSFPSIHGITDIPVFTDDGEIVDAFMNGDSSRLIAAPALAEVWDEKNGNEALIGMIGYEPWHLGMIGRGAERPGGDRDHAAWLDIETNEWITNPDVYRLPVAISDSPGLQADIRKLDAADGNLDGAWGDHAILEERDRLEETPAFIAYHGRTMRNLIAEKGYGTDRVTDFLFTNFKQIDRVGHYFNMASGEVRQSVVDSDRELGRLVEFLDGEVGRGRYVVVVTADHGQQPDDQAIGGYGINPRAITSDVNREFGPVVINVRPTQMFLDKRAMQERGVSEGDIARFLADYRVEDNTDDPRVLLGGAGRFERGDRIFDAVVPSEVLTRISCPGS
jgi:arylsulfatase A-like enzyme